MAQSLQDNIDRSTLTAKTSLDRDARIEQLRSIFAHTRFATVAATTFAVALSLQLFVSDPSLVTDRDWILLWLALKVIVAGTRAVHDHHLANRLAKGLPPGHLTVPLLAIDGLTWGIGGALLMHRPAETWALVAASLCGISFIATFGLQVSISAASAYVVPILLPVSIALMARVDRRGLAAGAGLLILLALMLSAARRSDRRMVDMLRHKAAAAKATAELEIALGLAQTHSESRDRFLAVISHELRTPLHGILGLAHLTRKELRETDAHIGYRIALIEDAAMQLQRLVDDILDLSLIDARRLQLKPGNMSLAREFQLMTATYKARGEEAGISIVDQIDPAVGDRVLGDPDRIAQVLHNLLGNALKFVPVGGTIVFKATRADAGPTVRIDVIDNGPGISAADSALIFNAFSQGTWHAGSRPEGVGLGLTIARELARAMDGDVTCESVPGAGTTFTFTAKLPLLAVETATPSTQNSARQVAQVRDDGDLEADAFSAARHSSSPTTIPRAPWSSPRSPCSSASTTANSPMVVRFCRPSWKTARIRTSS